MKKVSKQNNGSLWDKLKILPLCVFFLSSKQIFFKDEMERKKIPTQIGKKISTDPKKLLILDGGFQNVINIQA